MHIIRSFVVASVLGMTLAGCQAPSPSRANVPATEPGTAGDSWTRTELFFGLNRNDGGKVSDADWQKFVDYEITPLFPNGLTVLAADGQWRTTTTSPVVHEQSRVVVILHRNSALDNKNIEQIRAAYKKMFSQDAVMRTDSVERVSF